MLPMYALKEIGSLGQNVVVVGGGEIGLEAGLAVARTGRKVTVLSRRKRIPCDMHTQKALFDYMRELPDFSYLSECRTEEIGADHVLYTDKDGKENRIACDTVIFSGGRAPETEASLRFAETFPETYIIGDGYKPATVREAVFSAYCAAMRL
jgi:2-enoate reductase